MCLAILNLMACDRNSKWSSVSIDDVTQKQIITLHKKTRGNVYSFQLLIEGTIDGRAVVQQLNSDKGVYRQANISTDVHLNWAGDWYTDECQILYEPTDVKSGSLQLKYKMETL